MFIERAWHMLDTCHTIETPEGIDIELRPAGPSARIFAYLTDLLIRWTVLVGASLILLYLQSFGAGLLLILYFLLEWFYPLLFEVYRQGMTPGKKLMGLRVVHDDGTPVSWNGALIRNLLRTVDFLPFFYCAGIISCVVERNFKRLGDIAAGTLVVYNHQPHPVPAASELGSRPTPLPLDGDEQRALLNFAERRDRISQQRQQELADILHPITGKSGVEGVNELVKIANGLTGAG
jgi:uncharacterized RDD family membrane protein YckC